MATYELRLKFDWTKLPPIGNGKLDHELFDLTSATPNKPVVTTGTHTFRAKDHVSLQVRNANADGKQIPHELTFLFSQADDPVSMQGKHGKNPFSGKGKEPDVTYALREYKNERGVAYFAPEENSGKGTTLSQNLLVPPGESTNAGVAWDFKIHLNVLPRADSQPSKARTFIWDPELIVDPYDRH